MDLGSRLAEPCGAGLSSSYSRVPAKQCGKLAGSLREGKQLRPGNVAQLPRVLVCVPCSPRGESSSLPGPAPTCLAGGPGTCVLPFTNVGFSLKKESIVPACHPQSVPGASVDFTAVCALGWGTRRAYQGSVLEDGTRHPTHEGEAPENQLGSPGGPWLDPTQCRRPHSSGAAVHSGGSQSATSRFVSHPSGS